MTHQPPAESARQLQTLVDERRDAFGLVTASDAILGLVHDINNSLNSIMLQASIVEMKVGEPLRDEVAQIRRFGNELAGRLALVRQFRDRSRQARTRVDVNECVREVLALEPDLARRFQAVLTDKPVPLLVNAAAFKRLTRLLLSVVCARQPANDVRLRICVQSDKQLLRLVVEPTGNHPEQVLAGWEAIPNDPDGPLPLMERMAIEALARLVEATLSAHIGEHGNLSISLDWPGDAPVAEPET